MHAWVFGANYLVTKIVTQLNFLKMHEGLQKVLMSY